MRKFEYYFELIFMNLYTFADEFDRVADSISMLLDFRINLFNIFATDSYEKISDTIFASWRLALLLYCSYGVDGGIFSRK